MFTWAREYADKVMGELEHYCDALKRIADAQERQAAALEKTANQSELIQQNVSQILAKLARMEGGD